MKWIIEKTAMAARMQEAVKLEGNRPNGDVPRMKARLTKETERSYEIYDKAELAVLLKKSFHVWIEYSAVGYSISLQKNYEIFCGGWLHFWDRNISTEEKERKIYFDWSNDTVKIHISNETKRTGYRITLTVDGPGDPPVVPPPPPPGDA
jgi:hypothetical protein